MFQYIIMMRKFLSALATLAISIAATAQTSGQFTIKGTLMNGVDGDTIILAMPSGGGLTALDTAIVKSGTFNFAGQVDGAQLLVLLGMSNRRPVFGSTIVAEATTINVRLYKDPNREPDVVGNVTNSLWRLFAMRDAELMSEAQPYANAMKRPSLAPQQQKAFQTTLDSLSTLRMANVVSFVSEHKETVAADLVFEMYSPMLNDADRDKLSSILATNTPTLPGYRRTMARVQQEAAAHRTDVGRKFTDFSCPDTNGQPVKLSDIVKRSKVTLLDFWASWCGPCRMEMPTVRRAYEYFHSKGLEIVGVSLDSNKQSWENAITTLDMSWLQLSDLKGWRCEPAQLYGVHSIPSCILISQDGTILAKDLRGEKLIQTLLNVLK